MSTLRRNAVKDALRAGQAVLGTSYGQLRDVEIARILKAAGFDYAYLDGEHGGFGIETQQDICRVAALCGLTIFVRVADMQYDLMARSLDCGAEGVIFPRVESAELLAQAVAWCKFPPVGIRGFGLTAMQNDYQAAGIGEVMEQRNETGMIILQIETLRALEAREELLSVPGVDVVMVGPVDLSISLGVPGQFDHPKMIEALEKIQATCEAKGIFPGIQARNLALAKTWKERGYKFIGCGSEWAFLLEKGKEVTTALRG